MAVTPQLWTAIESALSRSRYFLLLASPAAAQSKWVAQEVHWWLTHRSAEQLLIVLTDGELAWDSAAGDFDWTRTNALPRVLEKAFRLEPLDLDLRWAKTSAHVSLRRPDFADVIARLTATLRGLPLDDLIGEDVRQHQSAMRWARNTGLALLGLASAGILVSLVAPQAKRLVTPLAREQENQAADRARELLSTNLPAQALSLVESDRDLAILLATEAIRAKPTPAEESALRQSLFAELAPVLRLTNGTNASCYATFHPDGNRILTWGAERHASAMPLPARCSPNLSATPTTSSR